MVFSQMQVLTFVRNFCNSKYKNANQFNTMIDMIQKTNITSFKWFRPLFVQIKSQLEAWDSKIPEFQKSINRLQDFVRLGRYFNKGNDFDKKILQKLCLVIQQKLFKYISVDLNTSEQCFETSSSSAVQKNVIQQRQKLKFFSKVNQIFSEASMLASTIRSLSFMQNMPKTSKKSSKQSIQKSLTQLQSSKDQDLINLLKDIYKIKQSASKGIEKMKLNKDINDIFTDDEYFTVKEFVQSVNLLKQPKHKQKKQKKQQSYVHELELIDKVPPISTKCVGSIPFVTQNKSIQRERSTLTYFEVFPSIEDIFIYPKKFQQVVEKIISNNKGGVILFNCEDQFFQFFPNENGIQQIELEQKKQKLQENFKKLPKQMSLQLNFEIDFINEKKIDDSFKLGMISSFSNQNGQHGDSFYVSTNKYIPRLKITKRMDKAINQIGKIQN